jgi:polyisoprenyl-phosphate glycosyltransferase
LNKNIKLGIVLPSFNEELIIDESIKRVSEQISIMIGSGEISDAVVCVVDDNSRDSTWENIISASEDISTKIEAIKLSRNYGHQNALISGIKYLSGKVDCIITIDADLEQDVTKLTEFIKKYKEGSDVVLGIRNDRSNDSLFKKITANLYFSLTNLFGMNLEKNHADYRLISSKVAEELNSYSEVNLFLRGIIVNMGYPVSKVYFDVKKITGRKSRYSFNKMINLGIDSITSFTIIPLRIASFIGLIVIIFSLAMIFYTLISKLFFSIDAAGWASTVLPIYFIGGVNLLFLGIIGEYVGKIFLEVKKRPSNIIKKTYKNKI